MASKMTALIAYQAGKLRLPLGYHIQHEAGLMTLHRADGYVVAVFVAGTTPAKVARAAQHDYRASGGGPVARSM